MLGRQNARRALISDALVNIFSEIPREVKSQT